MCSLANVKYFICVLFLATLSFAINISEYATSEPVWNVQQYIQRKLDQKSSQESTLEPSFYDKSPNPVNFHSRGILGIFHAKFGFRDQYMAHCETKEDCDAGIRMICKDNKCICRPGELFFEWPKFGCFVKAQMFEKCEVSGQCMAMNPNTYCNPDNGRCTCSPNYSFNGYECSLRYPRDDHPTVTSVTQSNPSVMISITVCTSLLAIVIIIIVAVLISSAIKRKKNKENGTLPVFATSVPPAPSAPEMPLSFATRIRQSTSKQQYPDNINTKCT